MNSGDETILKEILHRLLIDSDILRLVTAHLIVQQCQGADDPTAALRNLHGALDAAARLVTDSDKPPPMQVLIEEYQLRIDELITLASKLLSAD